MLPLNHQILEQMHHRINNNLQLLSSILSLEINYGKEKTTKEILIKYEHKIQNIAITHQKLSQSDDYMNLDIVDYINTLFSSYLKEAIQSNKINFNLNLKNKKFNADSLFPLGMILNEIILFYKLITAVSNQKTEIVVDGDIGREDYILSLKMRNYPVHLVSAFIPDELSRKIIKGCAKQIQAVIDTDFPNGTFKMKIPL